MRGILVAAASKLFGRRAEGLRRLLRDEQGDEGVNKILIIALVAIPLVLILIFFGQEIVGFITGAKEDVDNSEPIVDPDTNPFR